MPLTSIYVPFENQSLNGVIRTIARKTNSKNISSDGFVSVTASSISSGYPSIIILDHDDTEIWRTKPDDENKWFIIDFGLFRVDIEGYTLKVAPGDYRSEWKIYASEDCENWELIGIEGVTTYSESTRSYKTKNNRLRFFKMQASGVAVKPEYTWFAMGSVDIFGKLIVPSSLNFLSKHNNLFFFSISTLVYVLFFMSGS